MFREIFVEGRSTQEDEIENRWGECSGELNRGKMRGILGGKVVENEE